ncbi:dimethylaniline monooxygenase [N-oxide-forming] [Elysia marginata]|uniref:Flavin-containing monooxygenase n=1 Tax=Elysia marginata TaxID=1093978 RepID=A0AAV4F4A9_9GAST|nr:dimethylaniline monooxygenase [N-oxide-forming] [Elysia marginata]
MTSVSQRVAVIGAGASGLTAIKCCLDEGLTPVCFERTTHIGGLWHYHDEPVKGQTCVMKSTVINSCKELMSYSDFLIPKDFPNYMHNSQVLEYFRLYADRFGLNKYINFQTEVQSVKKADDYATTGRWKVCYRDVTTGETETEIFDAVMVCSGRQTDVYRPQFEGLNDFQGKVLHMHEYRKPDGFQNARALVIGIGNSGGDCATEISRVAKQTFLSTRRGSWVIYRVSEKGYPQDLVINSRCYRFFQNNLGRVWEKWMEYKLNYRFDHTMYRLKPKHSFYSYQPLVNDDLPNRIISGRVKVKDNVRRFTKTGVEFVDGSKEEIDLVILATGYTTSYPFLEKEVLQIEEKDARLYKLIFPPDLEKSTLAMIGCLQPLGPLPPMAEMQCRMATRVFKGLLKLPDAPTMWKDIEERDAAIARQYLPSVRYSILVDYLPYMDELSKVVGCYPSYATMFKDNPAFALKMWFTPIYPCAYRLYGPGKWDGAKQAVLTAMDRVKAPFQTRPLAGAYEEKSGDLSRYLVGLFIFFIACLTVFMF